MLYFCIRLGMVRIAMNKADEAKEKDPKNAEKYVIDYPLQSFRNLSEMIFPVKPSTPSEVIELVWQAINAIGDPKLKEQKEKSLNWLQKNAFASEENREKTLRAVTKVVPWLPQESKTEKPSSQQLKQEQ